MTELQKTIVACLLGVTTLLLVTFLWQSPILLAILLAGVGVAMLFVEQKWSALIIYLFVFFVGPFNESVVILSGAWSYTEPHIFVVPIWLSFTWGNTALFFYRTTVFLRSLDF